MRRSFTLFLDWRALWGYFFILLHIRTCESLHCLAIYLTYIRVRVQGFQCLRLWLSENPWQTLPTEARLISNFMEYDEDKYYIYVYICALLCIMITQYYTYILMTGWCHLSLYPSVFGILLVDTDDLFTDFEDFDSLLWESPLAGRDREVRVQPLGKALYPGVSRWWDLLVRCYGIHRRITRRNTEVGPAHNVQPFVQADTQKSCGEATLRQNQNVTLIRFSSCSGLFDILQYCTYLSNYL